jgi:hypothetical protein
VGLTTPHSQKLIVTKVEQRNKLDRFNDDGRKRTRYTEIMPKKIFTKELEGTRRKGRPRKGWREEVERDLQVLGVRWKELVIDRGKMERYRSTGQSTQRAVAPTE